MEGPLPTVATSDAWEVLPMVSLKRKSSSEKHCLMRGALGSDCRSGRPESQTQKSEKPEG